SLELCFLVPARQAQRHLREAKPLVGEEVLNTFLGRAERAPAPDSGWTELLAVVGLKEALRFPKGLMSILIDVDVVVEVCLEAVRVAACVQQLGPDVVQPPRQLVRVGQRGLPAISVPGHAAVGPADQIDAADRVVGDPDRGMGAGCWARLDRDAPEPVMLA